MSDDYFDRLDAGEVTPDDIRLAVKTAIAAGGNPAALNRKLKEAIKEAGGTIEDLAQAWTRHNQWEERMAAFRAEFNRNRRKP